MKRLFLTLLCLLIFCGIADARMLQGVAGSVAANASSEYSGLSKFYGNVCIGCGGTYN